MNITITLTFLYGLPSSLDKTKAHIVSKILETQNFNVFMKIGALLLITFSEVQKIGIERGTRCNELPFYEITLKSIFF